MACYQLASSHPSRVITNSGLVIFKCKVNVKGNGDHCPLIVFK